MKRQYDRSGKVGTVSCGESNSEGAAVRNVRSSRPKNRAVSEPNVFRHNPNETSIGKNEKVASPSRLRAAPFLVAPIAAYIAALFYARDQIPGGLNNDAAEEALRGLYLVEGRHFEVITFSLGHSAETLYLYLLGAAAQLFSPSTLAIQFWSWICALVCIVLVWKLVQRIDGNIPAWLPLLIPVCSIWLLHYARSGLRAICAPVFLAGFTLLLERVERRPRDRIAGLLCGAVLGLSIYGYTSCRVLPIAFVVYAAFRLFREKKEWLALIQRYGAVVAGALATSIPNIVFFLRQPHEFLTRGDYVLQGTGMDRAINSIWSALLPWYYPDTYRILGGPNYNSDGVSAGLTSSGFNPIHIMVAAAIAVGLWQARRWREKPAVAFLLATWVVAVLTLGIAGPSLTRFLILLPVYLVFAGLGFGFLMEWRSQLRIPILLLILWVGFSDGYQYLSGRGEAPEYFASAATTIGQEAAKLASQGHKVVCVVSRDANVVNFLVHKESARVKVAEFYQRPVNPAEIPLKEFRPNILLIENNAAFNSFAASIPPAWRRGQNERFTTVQLPGL